MITLAGTEPSTLFGMAEVLGVGSPEAKTLQQQMVTRMGLMSDPAQRLVNNPALLHSVQTTDGIASQIIKDITAKVTKAVEDQAHDRRNAAIRDTVLVLARHRCRAGHRVAGRALADPAAAGAARRRVEGRARGSRTGDHPGTGR